MFLLIIRAKVEVFLARILENKLTEEKSDKSSFNNERGRDTYRSGQLLTSRVLENDSPDAITSIIILFYYFSFTHLFQKKKIYIYIYMLNRKYIYLQINNNNIYDECGNHRRQL